MSHITDDKGVHPNPDRIKAIQQAPRSNNVGDIRRFLEMANQITKVTGRSNQTTTRPVDSKKTNGF